MRPAFTLDLDDEDADEWQRTFRAVPVPLAAREADFDPEEHPRDENGKFSFKGTPSQKTRDEMLPSERMDEDLRKKADPKRGRWDEGSGGATADPGHKPIRSGGARYWGASHTASSAITGASADMMGITGYRTDIALDHKTATADAFLHGIYESPGSNEALYHGFQNTEKIDWKVGDTLSLPLLASSGDRDHSLGYGIRSDLENQRGEPTVFEFPRGTPMAGYSKWNKEDIADFGHVWSEAIVAGKFRIAAIGSDEQIGWQSDRSKTVYPEGAGHAKIKVVRLEPTEKFNPNTKEWVKV